MSAVVEHSYRFGAFTIDADQKVLLRHGKPMHLTPKAFDTLLTLVENRGRVLNKEELMNRLWPDSFVEEANLAFNIQQLRKALGDNARRPQYIETMPRRGYRFIAEVEHSLKSASDIAAQANNAIAGAPAFLQMNRRRTALASVALLALAIVGSLVWRFSKLSNGDLREFMAALPLKLEKLTATGQSQHVAISPDGKYLAYTQGFGNKQSIWLRQLVSGTNTEIVPADTSVDGLSFSHSGEYIYFVKGKPTALYRVSMLGGVPVKIVDRLEGKFSLSPDDRQIAFIRQWNNNGRQEYSLNIINYDAASERSMLTRKYPYKLDAPAWSPDGKSIICAYGETASGSQNVSLLEVSVDDGTTRELSAERFANIARIAWLPQKSGLIMTATRKPDDYRQLWQVSYPSMELRQLTAGSTIYSDLSITTKADKIVATQTTRASDLWVGESPQHLKRINAATDKFDWVSNRQLVYSSSASGNTDLWVMQPDGTEQKQLTVNAGSNGAPAVTSDDRYIVFTSSRSGALQVWRMNVDGSNQIQLTNGVGKNFPAVSPDGKWIVYNSTDNWDLWKVSIDGGEPARLSERPAVFPAVSPDGKMIACLGRGESKAAILLLSFDDGQLMKTIDLAAQNFAGVLIQWTPDGQGLIYPVERNGATTLVKQPLNDGRTEEIIKFDDELFDFGYSPDGKMLAVTRGGWQHDVVLISDLNLR